MVDTKRVTDRRILRFAAMDDILADVEALDGEAVRSSGNWSAAQNVQHVTRFIAGSIDGFEARAPLPLRLFGRVVRSRVLRGPLGPGFKVPSVVRPAVEPDPDVAWEDALQELRHEIERIRGGARMTADSPLFGRMTHEEWVMLHSRHAELHFSFIQTE